MTDQSTEAPGSASPQAPGQPTTERVRSIFSTIAPKYDDFNRISSMGIDRSWRRRLVAECGLTSESRVLDICAGTGDVGLEIARRAEPAEVLITDFTPEMLDVARDKVAAYEGRTRIEIEQADAQALQFEDARFDVVTVAFGVRNLPDRAANFAEVLRVLRPGGRYVILEFSRPTFAPWRWAYHIYLSHVIPFIGGMLTGDRPSFVYLNDSIRQFPPQEALAVELRSAGFSAVRFANLTGGIAALHIAEK